ncbi:MAG: hypothetical protein AB8E15_13115 [Bdellovibrionales bacterium]
MFKVFLKEYVICKVFGLEAEDWLHRITSNHILSLKVGDAVGASFLTGKAGVISVFNVYRKSKDIFFLVVPGTQEEKFKKYLEDAHFGEDLELVFSSGEDLGLHALVGIELSSKLAGDCFPSFPLKDLDHFMIFQKTGKIDFKLESEEFYLNLLRSQSYPSIPSDFGEKDILTEAQVFDKIAHDDKGCYPGQEVINKIRNIGKLPRRIFCLKVLSGSLEFEDNTIVCELGKLKALQKFTFQDSEFCLVKAPLKIFTSIEEANVFKAQSDTVELELFSS